MTLDGIKTTAQHAGKVAFESGTIVVKALGRVCEYSGTALSAAAKKVADWVKIFIKNLPVYSQIAKDYASSGINHASSGINYILQNKKIFAIGVGSGVALSVLTWGAAKLFHKSEEI